jgi:predicted RNA polymerase sigma factor
MGAVGVGAAERRLRRPTMSRGQEEAILRTTSSWPTATVANWLLAIARYKALSALRHWPDAAPPRDEFFLNAVSMN